MSFPKKIRLDSNVQQAAANNQLPGSGLKGAVPNSIQTELSEPKSRARKLGVKGKVSEEVGVLKIVISDETDEREELTVAPKEPRALDLFYTEEEEEIILPVQSSSDVNPFAEPASPAEQQQQQQQLEGTEKEPPTDPIIINNKNRETDPFNCDICSKSFTYDWEWKSHIHSHTRVIHKPFKCLHCPMAFISEQTLSDHVLLRHVHQSMKCPRCSYNGFRDNEHLTEHIETSCESPVLTSDNSESEIFCCNFCSFGFLHPSFLQFHLQLLHNIFSCSVCDFSCGDQKTLFLHQSTSHEGYCAYCGEHFPSAQELNSHQNPYECKVCYQSFSLYSDLVKHVEKEHYPIFKCRLCGSVLPSEKKMWKHVEESDQEHRIEYFKAVLRIKEQGAKSSLFCTYN